LRAQQSSAKETSLDCFVARAPRNDELSGFRRPLTVIASEVKQSNAESWVASSQGPVEGFRDHELQDVFIPASSSWSHPIWHGLLQRGTPSSIDLADSLRETTKAVNPAHRVGYGAWQPDPDHLESRWRIHGLHERERVFGHKPTKRSADPVLREVRLGDAPVGYSPIFGAPWGGQSSLLQRLQERCLGRSIRSPQFAAVCSRRMRQPMLGSPPFRDEYANRVQEWGRQAVPADWIAAQLDFMLSWEREKLAPGLL
jgi:hypothetical protein